MSKTTDWNSINLQLLIENDRKEINKLYKYTKPYFFVRFFHNDEELFNDLIICILANVKSFDPEKGLFSNWIYTIAKNKRNHQYEQKQKQISTTSINNLINTPILDKYNTLLDYESWNNDEKLELENKIQSLSESDKQFVEWYMIAKQNKTPAERQRYSRLVKKLSK
jgi:DNA-directed RNA polymerase specialized sigma24 family protein